MLKYIKIFIARCKISFMSVAVFRANFILMLIQSIINSMLSILCVEFLYGNIESIAGWNKNEMIILICTSLIINQLYRGLILPNQMIFVNSISTSGFDKMILKPLNILFQINIGNIDISSLLSIIAPLITLLIQLINLNIEITISSILIFIFLIINSLIIISSFMLFLYSFSFIFIKIDGLHNIYYLIMNLSEKPKEIFSGKTLVYSFTFLIPVIPIANIPTSILLGNENVLEIIFSVLIGIILLTISNMFVNIGIKKYTSASN